MMNQVLEQLEIDLKLLGESEQTNVESNGGLLERVRQLPMEGKYGDNDLIRISALSSMVIDRIEKTLKSELQNETGFEMNDKCCGLYLQMLVHFLKILPAKLLKIPSKIEEITDQIHSVKVVQLDLDFCEPIGLDLLLICSSLYAMDLQRYPASHSKAQGVICFLNSKLELYNDLKSGALLGYYLQKYLGEIMCRLLPVFKNFREKDDCFTTVHSPQFEERFYQGNRLVTIICSLEITDEAVRDLIPSVLFLLDDFNSRVANLGVQALHRIIKNTIGNRLLSSDIELWRELVPIAVLFVKRVRSITVAEVFFDQMLKRVSTDVEPFEFGILFVECAESLIEVLALSTTQFFSALFPSLTQWLICSNSELQLQAVNLLNILIKNTAPRILRHFQIISKILESLETSTKASDDLKSSVKTAKQTLNEVKESG
eukprot:g175.t1